MCLCCENKNAIENALINVLPHDDYNLWYPLSIILLRGCKPVEEEVLYQVFVTREDEKYPVSHEEHQFDDASPDSVVWGFLDCGGKMRHYMVRNVPGYKPNFVLSDCANAPGTYYINVVLPSGKIIKSNGMFYPNFPNPV